MFPRVEVRHLQAVLVLAEELNFTRAADRLHITQSGFSKQINEVEAQHGFRLFIRQNKKNVELTEVGRIFVEEARQALLHIDRAVHAAREGSDSILTVGHSPDADQAWISAILAIRLPMYPKLRIQLISEFSRELVRSVNNQDTWLLAIDRGVLKYFIQSGGVRGIAMVNTNDLHPIDNHFFIV